MSNEIIDLLEKQGRAFEEFKAQNDARLKAIEAGKSDADFKATLDRINAELDETKKALDEVAKKATRPAAGAGSDADPDKLAYKQAFGRFMRNGVEDGLRELEAKAHSIGVPADGGYAVPEEIDRAILSRLVDISPVRSVANVVSVGTSDYKKLVNRRGTASGWVGETAARPATDTAVLSEKVPFWGELYANPQATQQMLDDVFFNADAWIAEELATEFARAEGAAFIAGDGTNKPRGFLAGPTAATPDASRADGTIQHIPTGVAGDWAASDKADVLITLIHALRAGHRANAVFMMNKALLAEIRSFKDADGQYLWRPGLEAGMASTLLGFPVVEAEDMPAKAANSLSVAFGNFRAGYTIVDRLGVRTLRDPYSNKPYVGFYTTKRVGGILVDSEAIKVLRFATT